MCFTFETNFSTDNSILYTFHRHQIEKYLLFASLFSKKNKRLRRYGDQFWTHHNLLMSSIELLVIFLCITAPDIPMLNRTAEEKKNGERKLTAASWCSDGNWQCGRRWNGIFVRNELIVNSVHLLALEILHLLRLTEWRICLSLINIHQIVINAQPTIKGTTKSVCVVFRIYVIDVNIHIQNAIENVTLRNRQYIEVALSCRSEL